MRWEWIFVCLALFISCDDDGPSPSTDHADKIPDCMFISEPLPEFPGGQSALDVFIQNHLFIPKSQTHTEGKVFVAFVVGKDGFISNVEVVRGLNDVCDQHAITLVKKMPRWKPAKDLNGNLVRTRIVLPVKFCY